MKTNKKAVWWMIPAALFFAAGFAVATRWDLAIDLALYRPEWLPGRLMEAFGWLVAFLPALLLVLLWAVRGRENPLAGRWRFPVGLGVYGLGMAILYAVCHHYLVKRGLAGPAAGWPGWLWLVAWVTAGALGLWWVLRLGEEAKRRLWVFALAGSAYMLANQAVVNLLKFIWQRPRFDQMLLEGNFDAFRPWYLPFGPGGSSFPSGHTANACGILMLVVLCDLFPAWNRHRKLVYTLSWAYVVFMSVCRMMIGRHFLSDTLAAMALMALLFFALRRTGIYRRAVKRVWAENGAQKESKE